jgi:hypothetical protein
MGKLKEIHAEISNLTTSELEQLYRSLVESPSKSVRDEIMQEFCAVELDNREGVLTWSILS